MNYRRRDPIIAQLRQRLLAARHLGTMQPGDRLPPIRTLAYEFETTQRVIMAALHELANEGLVEFRPRLGVFLAAASSEREPVPAWLVRAARPLLRESILRGSPASTVSSYLQRLLERARARVICVECNDDHADALCRELDRDYGFRSRHVELDDVRGARARRTLARADLVVTTSEHAETVRAAAADAHVSFLAVPIRRDLIAEVEKLLAVGAVFFIGTDIRYEAKLKRMFSGVPGAKRLRVSIVGRDDPNRIPESVPIYIMERAWKRLGAWKRRRVMTPIQRLIDDSAIDELLGVAMEHNLAAPA